MLLQPGNSEISKNYKAPLPNVSIEKEELGYKITPTEAKASGCVKVFLILMFSPLILMLVALIPILWLLSLIFPRMNKSRAFAKKEMFFSSCPVHPGDNFSCKLHLQLKYKYPVEKIEAKLICQEKIKYTVGTDTTTYVENLFSMPLKKNMPDKIEFPTLTASFDAAIPEDGCVTYATNNNFILWIVEVTTTVEVLGEIKTDFEVLVLR